MIALRILIVVTAVSGCLGECFADEPDKAAAGATPLADLTAARRAQRDAEAAIRQKLTQRLNFDFADTPLRDALAFVSEVSGLPSIRLEEDALKEAGMDNPTVTLKAEKATVAQVLHHLLTPKNLTWVIENESLIVTTLARDEQKLTTVVYPVGKLMRGVEAKKTGWRSRGPAVRSVASAAATPTGERDSEAAAPAAGPPRESFETAPTFVLRQFGEQKFHAGPADPMRSLIELLQQSTTGPWEAIDGSGGTISRAGSALVVRQTRTNHDEIAGILRGLQAFAEGTLKQRTLELRPDWYALADDARLRERLAARIPQLDFADVPLPEVASFLADQTAARLAIDAPALANAGVEAGKTITLRADNVTLRSALDLILKPLKLTALVEHGTIVITTEDAAAARLCAILYDVRDLTSGDVGVEKIVEILTNETEGPWEARHGEGGKASAFRDGAIVVHQTQHAHEQIAVLLADLRATAKADGLKPAEKEEASPDEVETRFYPIDRKGSADGLQKSFVAFVSPESWKENGGNGVVHVVGSTLAVRQTKRVHGEIRAFLAELKAAEEMP